MPATALQSFPAELVYTIKDKCRVCYTCVRECPVKAIKIINGQAEVVPERCIACGNCTRVCSQGAKVFLHSQDKVKMLLDSGQEVYAMLAPSFISEFTDFENYRTLVGTLRSLGFRKVFEVAFGADLVALEYRKLIRKKGINGYISSDCPAIVSYIEKYHPELIGSLAPVVSPMVAMSRYLKKAYGKNIRLVFIGPCIAKKAESAEVDEKLTFVELRDMIAKSGLIAGKDPTSEFDTPFGGKGAIFPISRGLLQTVNLSEEEIERNVIVAEGRVDFQEAIREYQAGVIEGEHLELLCCEGCIMGPGTSKNGKKFQRRSLIMNYVREKLLGFDYEKWQKEIDASSLIDLSRAFGLDNQRIPDPSEQQTSEVLRQMNKFSEADHLNCGACGYDTCRNHAIAITKGLAEIEMCLPYTIDQLHHSIDELAVSNQKLMSVQQTLKQTEKLAHMGQLSAGIAHELNNPLGVVIMYANILLEETPVDSESYQDLQLVVGQAERCKRIVAGLLNFARKNQVNHMESDLNELVRKSIGSVIVPKDVEIEVFSSLKNPFAEIDEEQMVQAISNLIKNAVEAMTLGGKITISLEDEERELRILITDTGTGISEENLQKVFEPFFTTKGIGKGTGLGLATAYGVIKMHKGSIRVDSNANPMDGPTFTRFKIQIPRR